ncbi:hypothetical protein KC351_g26 [Hortaea werneckii]|nr:hypothetical protein KC351_g26 [Hortaea werneckii]
MTRIPIASANTDSWLPTCPYPTIPNVLPLTSQQPADTLFQTPWCSSLFRSPICLAREMISPIICSATERDVFEVYLVRTNAEAANDDQVLCVLEHVGRELRLRPNANDVHILDLLNQFVLRERALEDFDLVALLLQDVLARLVDVLEQQDFDVLGVERLQALCRSGQTTTKAPGWTLEAGIRASCEVVVRVGDGAVEAISLAVRSVWDADCWRRHFDVV